MKVKYNGRAESYLSCTGSVKDLVRGGVYEVVAIHEGKWQTNYTLKGLDGEFNSVWFDEDFLIEPTYLAFATEAPVVGRSLRCNRVRNNGLQMTVEAVITSEVVEVEPLGGSTFKVATLNSVYIVQVA